MDSSNISRMENGERIDSLIKLMDVANALDIDARELFDAGVID